MKKLFSCLLFIGIMTMVFLKVTYLFRNDAYERNRIVGIKEKGELDVVYVGGSNVFSYWEPPRAWGEYGITSYDYGTSGMQAETLLGSLREIQKTQSPVLFIIGVRLFKYYRKEVYDLGIRYTTDSMDYSWNRLQTVHDYLSNRELEEGDALSYYFDIAKYHTETKRLGNQHNWEFSDNRDTAEYNGYSFYQYHEALSDPEKFMADKQKELEEGSRKTLTELLEYCQQEELNVLFVFDPYWRTEEDRLMSDSVQDAVEAYGFKFLNANEYYDEMEIDFSKDFADRNHVNAYGAEKYTRFLAEYIKQHYQIAGHRGEEGMKGWDMMYDTFLEEGRSVKNAIDALIAEKQDAYLEGLRLAEIDNLYEWHAKAKNANYTILMEFQGKPWSLDADAEWMLGQWGIPYDAMSDAVRVYIGEEQQYASDIVLEENYQGSFAGHSDYVAAYEINSGKDGGIWIDGEKCDLEGGGLHVVVYDNNYREVLDSVVIFQTKEGVLQILRKKDYNSV